MANISISKGSPAPGRRKSSAVKKPMLTQAEGFTQKLASFSIWREQFVAAIEAYQEWVEQNEPAEGANDLRIYELIEALKSDKLKIAFMGEFSRGKTELLNALFFSDYKKRLLPSSAGRTTMCPTELRYDVKTGSCIKLLPIETRKTDTTIAEYKQNPVQWTTLHLLKRDSGEELEAAFLEVTKTKRVHTREAEELGLYDPNNEIANRGVSIVDDMIEIPCWRHAIINYSHPLLEKGLVILDTPGLNALGSEPELTLSMLPEAHAVVFVLAADTGVTVSDMEIWNNHVTSAKKDKLHERLVVLNKIDAMWDPLRTESEVKKLINNQIESTARSLKENRKIIMPVSAKAGLTAKINNDRELLEKSGINYLELCLAKQILPAKYEIIRRKVVYEVSGRVEKSQQLLKAKYNGVDNQLKKLKELGGKNLDEIQEMVSMMRKEKKKYEMEIKGFEITRKVLTEQAGVLFNDLSLKALDQLIRLTRKNMKESWTTAGLKKAIRQFFRTAMNPMGNIKEKSEGIKKSVDEICLKMHKEYGLPLIRVPALSLVPYVMDLKKLEGRAEVFRSSAAIIVTEQNTVISKFFVVMVSEARKIYDDCSQHAQGWFQELASQVHNQLRVHKNIIDKGLESIRAIHDDIDTIGQQISSLEQEKANIASQLGTVNGLFKKIQKPIV